MTQKEFDSLCPGTRLYIKAIAYGIVTKVAPEDRRTVFIKWNDVSSEIRYTLPLLADYEFQYPNNSVRLEEII